MRAFWIAKWPILGSQTEPLKSRIRKLRQLRHGLIQAPDDGEGLRGGILADEGLERGEVLDCFFRPANFGHSPRRRPAA